MLYEVITPHQGEIFEYVFVTRGILEITVEGKAFILHENEFLKFAANHNHGYRCLGVITSYSIHYTKLYEVEEV